MSLFSSLQNERESFKVFSPDPLRGSLPYAKPISLSSFLKSMMFVSIFSFLFSTLAFAEKNTSPRFVSLKSNEINERVGPGSNYPVEWVYLKAGLPVEIIAEFDNWRKIRDREGAEGWVHQSMLCSKRHGIIQGGETLIYSGEDLNSSPLARVEPGVVVNILKCRGDWCQIRILDLKGWVLRAVLWGVYPQEII
jgi:SH3-like domain-containing protein